MRAKGVLCAFVGHKWKAPEDIHETYPLFECTRCGRRQEFAAGTHAAGYDARLDVKTRRTRSRTG